MINWVKRILTYCKAIFSYAYYTYFVRNKISIKSYTYGRTMVSNVTCTSTLSITQPWTNYYAQRSKVEIKSNCCPSVCPSARLSLSQTIISEGCILELWLLYTSNRKPNAGSQTHWSAWPRRHQMWPKRTWGRKTYVVSILKTERDRAMVTTKRK